KRRASAYPSQREAPCSTRAASSARNRLALALAGPAAGRPASAGPRCGRPRPLRVPAAAHGGLLGGTPAPLARLAIRPRRFPDRHRRGPIHTNRAVPFEAQAHTADGQPKLDLDQATRWRAKVLTHYENGRWQPLAERPRLLRDADHPGIELPDVGPDQYLLTF